MFRIEKQKNIITAETIIKIPFFFCIDQFEREIIHICRLISEKTSKKLTEYLNENNLKIKDLLSCKFFESIGLCDDYAISKYYFNNCFVVSYFNNNLETEKTILTVISSVITEKKENLPNNIFIKYDGELKNEME